MPIDDWEPQDLTPAPDPSSEEVTDLEALQRGSWMEKIRFAWRGEDKAILERIETGAGQVFANLFGDAVVEIDRFYMALRVPRQRNGIAVLDAQNRQVWETGEDNRPIERWDQLTGQDLEQTLMNLQRIKMGIVTQVNRLKNEAIYAKMLSDDIKDEAWGTVMQGTQGDRSARANRQSRVDRYHSYFRYVVWSNADVFLQELAAFMRRLEKVRDWRTWGDRGK
jgi:hypothetical protein